MSPMSPRFTGKARATALFLTGALSGTLLVAPASAHFTSNVDHLIAHVWDFVKERVHTKAQADARFARRRSEAYRSVGQAGQPSFMNGWTNFAGGYAGAGFYKDSQQVVHLRGTITGGNESVAFMLPPAYRPPANLFMPAAGGGDVTQAAIVAIFAQGGVYAACATTPCTLGLDGLTFRAGAPAAGFAGAGSTSTRGSVPPKG
jgi:hypothetical protein